MIAFFESCWKWFIDNRDNVIAFFTSTSFLATVTLILTFVKQLKSTNKNTLTLSGVEKAIRSCNNISNNVNNIESEVSKLLANVQSCEAEIVKSKEDNVLLNKKIDSIMEVMSIVYSTIKDDAIRNSVSSILITAKHEGDATKAQLEEQIETLKAEIEQLMNNANTVVSETVDKVKTAVIGTSKTSDKTNIMRY